MGNWQSVFRTDRFSVGIKRQTSSLIVAETSGFTQVDCLLPQVTYQAVQSAPVRSRAKSGTRSAPKPGRRMPRLSMKFPLNGRLGSYVFSAGTPTLAGMLQMFQYGEDSAPVSVSHQATCYEATSSDANTVINKTSTPKMGALVGFRNSDSEDCTYGWVTALSGGGPFTATLFEDLGVQPIDDDPRIPTLTYIPEGELETFGWTVRVTGESTEQDRRYIGFVPETFSITIEDDALYGTFTGPCYGGETEDDPLGGLIALTSILRMDSVRDTARYVLGSQSLYAGAPFDALDDGTLDPDGTCDIRNVAWNFTMPHHPLTGPGPCGVVACTVGTPDVTATVAVPRIQEYLVGNPERNILIEAWENESKIALNCYFGNRVGKILALSMPAGEPVKEPEPIEIDGVEYWQVDLMPGTPYQAPDGSDSDAGNAGWKLAVG